mmetsp:Transcript_39633/g.55280  ORF Transcript_39633/g.55280 Transcript_39633/m.55280 type:complete len:207 (-) Transcript_39633:74-694(-)
MRLWRALVHVGHGVVRVVLVLPPLHGEALAHVADEVRHQVTVPPVVKHLVVHVVMRQPPTLLPEERDDDCRERKPRAAAVSTDSHHSAQSTDGEGGQRLPNIICRASAVPPSTKNFGAQAAVRRLEVVLLGLGPLHVAHVEALQHSPSRLGVESSERVCGIVSSCGQDCSPSWVALASPSADVIHLAMDHNPAVVDAVIMLAHFFH